MIHTDVHPYNVYASYCLYVNAEHGGKQHTNIRVYYGQITGMTQRKNCHTVFIIYLSLQKP